MLLLFPCFCHYIQECLSHLEWKKETKIAVRNARQTKLWFRPRQQQDPHANCWSFPGIILPCLILSDEKDLFSLSTVCSSLLKAVEAFSNVALEEIKTKHKVDDTWEARIRDQSSIETDMERPLELPTRYLLWKARRTHLYTFGKSGNEMDGVLLS